MFFSDDIDSLKRFSFHNVLCRNLLTGRYCYGFLNEKTGKLTTGYEFEKNSDLSIELDQKEWKHTFIQDLTFD